MRSCQRIPTFKNSTPSASCVPFVTDGSRSVLTIISMRYRDGFSIVLTVKNSDPLRLIPPAQIIQSFRDKDYNSMSHVLHQMAYVLHLFISCSSSTEAEEWSPPRSGHEAHMRSDPQHHFRETHRHDDRAISNSPHDTCSPSRGGGGGSGGGGGHQTYVATTQDLIPVAAAALNPAHESRRRNAEQRAAILRADPLLAEVESSRVFCTLCHKWVQLRQDSSYCAYPWLQHRNKCLARL